VDTERLLIPGFSTGSNRISRPVSVTADLIFFADTAGRRAATGSGAADALRHLLVHDLEVVDLGGLLEDVRLRNPERVAERELNRWARSRVSSMCWRWSSPHRHLVSLVEQDVGGLQDR